MSKRVIIAGGGTGGHIFPAIAVANALKAQDATVDILFVGARDRMEMEKVPQAGYRIEGLTIAGFNRSSLLKNIGLPFKLIRSFWQVRSILRRFRPDAVLGVGGYSSYPVLRMAQAMGIPTYLHESNSFAGKANRWLGRQARRVFTGSTGMEAFFPAGKIMVTGNPVRRSIVEARLSKEEGCRFFQLEAEPVTILVVGGSLGARSINEAIGEGLDTLLGQGLQLVWQTGKPDAESCRARAAGKSRVWVNDFIGSMEYAYAAADIVVARAGAMTIAELCVAGKPVVFVPYPHAAEDHQTVNARKLVEQQAARMIADKDVKQQLVPVLLELAGNTDARSQLREKIGQLAQTRADQVIAETLLNDMKAA